MVDVVKEDKDPLAVYQLDKPLTVEEIEFLEYIECNLFNFITEAQSKPLAKAHEESLYELARIKNLNDKKLWRKTKRYFEEQWKSVGQERLLAFNVANFAEITGMKKKAAYKKISKFLAQLKTISYRLQLGRAALSFRFVNSILGLNNKLTLNSINNLVACLINLGRYSEALPLLQQILAERQTALGANHPIRHRFINLDSFLSTI